MTSSPRAAEPLSVSWIVPGLIVGSGGHRNILRIARFFGARGHQVRLYFTETDLSSAALTRLARRHFGRLQCSFEPYKGTIESCDALFATSWRTVAPVLRHRDVARIAAYFVQDFEPLFYAMGSEHLQAERTYRQGLATICSGPWCAQVLKERFGVDADHFLFPVDRRIYRTPRKRRMKGQRLLFFARPETPRRCFELGIEVLRNLHRLAPDVEIVLYGSAHLKGRDYPFPVRIEGLVPSLSGLAKLYGGATAGMVFSTTNPSLVPYEMMACGLPVIDLRRPGAPMNYGGREDIALLAGPNAVRMAGEVSALLQDVNALGHRSQAGLEFVSRFPSEDDVSAQVEAFVIRAVAGGPPFLRAGVPQVNAPLVGPRVEHHLALRGQVRDRQMS